jgi:hypothetical protein
MFRTIEEGWRPRNLSELVVAKRDQDSKEAAMNDHYTESAWECHHD